MANNEEGKGGIYRLMRKVRGGGGGSGQRKMIICVLS